MPSTAVLHCPFALPLPRALAAPNRAYNYYIAIIWIGGKEPINLAITFEGAYVQTSLERIILCSDDHEAHNTHTWLQTYMTHAIILWP